MLSIPSILSISRAPLTCLFHKSLAESGDPLLDESQMPLQMNTADKENHNDEDNNDKEVEKDIYKEV